MNCSLKLQIIFISVSARKFPVNSYLLVNKLKSDVSHISLLNQSIRGVLRNTHRYLSVHAYVMPTVCVRMASNGLQSSGATGINFSRCTTVCCTFLI
jgi:hypothetical protein